ncbi:MAG: DUF3576 domain-containing protein [Pseudomonadota bacterium]
MGRLKVLQVSLILGLIASLSACGAIRSIGGGGDGSQIPSAAASNPNVPGNIEGNPENTIWSIFNRRTADNTVAVNRYIWSASLEVLSFLPVQTVDPFTGVIVTGFGTPPGGGRAYRATVLVDDPALDARSLNVALQTRGGGSVSKSTSRAVEDAILSRARELRIADNRF